jgi:hypothetical protein
MLDTLQQSLEPKYIVDAAKKYLRGLKGHLVQDKRRAMEKKEGHVNGIALKPNNGQGMNGAARPVQAGPNSAQQEPPLTWDQVPVEERLLYITQRSKGL